MSSLRLSVASLRYSSWSIRALLPLLHAGAEFTIETAPVMQGGAVPAGDDAERLQALQAELLRRRGQGSVTGLFPVLHVDGTPIHESLAIAEWTAEAYPDAGLWPEPRLRRAQARSLCCEMASGFPNMRRHMSCHVSAYVPAFVPNADTRAEIARVFELWQGSLEAAGGPFLFGAFGIVDAMYYPVLTRFRTYAVALPSLLADYAAALEALPAVVRSRELAKVAPAIPVYDDYVRGLGGDPEAWRGC